MDLETVAADWISNASAGVVEAPDVCCATANTTLIGAHAEGRASLLLAPASCGLKGWLDIHQTRRSPYYSLYL